MPQTRNGQCKVSSNIPNSDQQMWTKWLTARTHYESCNHSFIELRNIYHIISNNIYQITIKKNPCTVPQWTTISNCPVTIYNDHQIPTPPVEHHHLVLHWPNATSGMETPDIWYQGWVNTHGVKRHCKNQFSWPETEFESTWMFLKVSFAVLKFCLWI